MSTDAKLKSYIDRILRCREAEDEAKLDTKNVYAELAGDGYEKSVVGQVVTFLRKREKDGDKLSEQSAKFDLYLDAYERPSHVHTRVRAEESAVANSPETATVPSSEQSEGNGSRDHQHVHSRQTDGAKHGGQDGEPAGADHASHLPEAANETMGGTGDDCSFGNRGVWPPQGGASSSRELDDISSEQVVTGGESAATIADQPLTGGDHEEVAGATHLVTGEGAANYALPTKPKYVLRPHCLNPGKECGGSGSNHCHLCRVAMQKSGVAA